LLADLRHGSSRAGAAAVIRQLSAAIEMRPTRSRFARLLSTAAIVTLVAAAAAGCQTTHSTDTTGSIALAPAGHSEADWRRDIEVYGAKYRANPADVDAGLHYAQALRAIGQRAQAVAILAQISMQHTPEQPDWHILSAQGAVLDQLGRHDEAQRHYLTALKIMPDEPSVLSNLGLSYALSKDLKNAEATLRRAAVRQPVDPRVRQNLALVVGLQGRFAEAEDIARADLPPDQAAANVAYLQQMLAHKGDVPLASQAARPGRG